MIEMNHTTPCPHCRADIDIGAYPTVGELIVCGLCNREFELLWLFPFELGATYAQVQTGIESKAQHLPN
ncbi:MAG: hypothetical protein HND51_12255 [Chloroflexi bacterium]|nr:hypothetical protein [Chloroflexota bacterium]